MNFNPEHKFHNQFHIIYSLCVRKTWHVVVVVVIVEYWSGHAVLEQTIANKRKKKQLTYNEKSFIEQIFYLFFAFRAILHVSSLHNRMSNDWNNRLFSFQIIFTSFCICQAKTEMKQSKEKKKRLMLFVFWFP